MNQSLLTPPKAQVNMNPLLAAPKKKKVDKDDTVGTNLVDGFQHEYRADGKHLLDQNCPRVYGSQNIKNDVMIVQDLVTYHRYYICLTCWWGDFFFFIYFNSYRKLLSHHETKPHREAGCCLVSRTNGKPETFNNFLIQNSLHLKKKKNGNLY